MLYIASKPTEGEEGDDRSTSIEQVTDLKEIAVFPNPAKEKVFVTIPSFKTTAAPQRLHLIDIIGRSVLSVNVTDSNM